MKNKLDHADIDWRFIASMAFDTFHHSKFRCEKYGIQKEAITNRSKLTGNFLKPKVYYFIDGCEKEMTSLDDLLNTWNELNEFDDPNNEIAWVKVIRKKKSNH